MPERDTPVTSDPRGFFAGKPLPMELFGLISRQVDGVGAATIHVSKSQIAFRRHRNFALVWMPDQYLRRQTGAARTDDPAHGIGTVGPLEAGGGAVSRPVHPSP